MHQPIRWWTGLVPLAAFWVVGTAVKTDNVEADIAGGARAALASLPADSVAGPLVVVSGRDVRVTGAGFSTQSALQAATATDAVYGVRLVDVQLDPPASARPYTFSARRNANQLLIDGSAPLPSTRDKIVAAARAATPGLAVVDGLKFAAGAPAGYETQAAYAIAQANLLVDGTAAFADGAFSVAGEAATSAIYEQAMAATRQLPQGLTLAKAEILPPTAKPYIWSATRDANGVTLAGSAPTQAARAATAARAAAIFPGVTIANQMQIARGAPAGDFAALVDYGLTQLGKLSGGAASLSDAAYSITGTAPTSAAYEAGMAAARQLPQGLTLAKADIQPPEARPFVWSAASDGNVVTLTGVAPSPAVRDAIAARAASTFAAARIVNQMRIARGAPAGDFGAAASFALGALGKLSEGKATLSDARLSIEGTGKTGVASAAMDAEARAGLPQGFAVAAIDVKEPVISPYVFTAEKTEGKLKLTGYYPDQKAHQDILAAAGARFNGDALDDQLAPGKGAPADFTAAVTGGFSVLARLANGALGISGDNIALKGEAIYDKAAAQIRAAFSGVLPQSFKPQAEIAVAPVGPPLDAAACQPKFNGLLANGKVQFETARADLHKDSIPLLDHIVGVALQCVHSEIEVGGHTDSDGAPDRNLNLSKRRAQAVVDYLTEAGLDGARIAAMGYGEQRPIASNDTADGKAQNRRIEISVK